DPPTQHAQVPRHRVADLGAARHHVVGAEPDRDDDGPEPAAVAGAVASAHAVRARRPRPRRRADRARGAADRPGGAQHHWRAAGDGLGVAARAHPDRALDLLEREAGQRHDPVAERPGVPPGAAGPVPARRGLDDRVPDRHAGRRGPARRRCRDGVGLRADHAEPDVGILPDGPALGDHRVEHERRRGAEVRGLDGGSGAGRPQRRPGSRHAPRMNRRTSMRSCYAGQVSTGHLDQVVTLFGWVHRRRDHGGVIFIDLRDREGLAQVVCDPDRAQVFEVAERVRNEYCVKVVGKVRRRPEGTVNPNIRSGEIEVLCQEIEILNPSVTPPFQLDDENLSETTRLTHRVLDLRRAPMQKNLMLRYRVAMEVRKYLDSLGFVDIETPMLTKSTPEGARDYLVPSRVNAGQFFALPQSPQLFKQLLMVAGFDRYYQITKCFRDEDLRADRQPEFTQIDCETSFLGETEIRAVFEDMIRVVFRNAIGVELPAPCPTMPYAEAVRLYGSDEPGLRVKLAFTDLTDVMKDVDVKVFSAAASSDGGRVVALRVPGGGDMTRSEIDAFGQFVALYGAKGLAWIQVNDACNG